jgi:hypothetical protein
MLVIRQSEEFETKLFKDLYRGELFVFEDDRSGPVFMRTDQHAWDKKCAIACLAGEAGNLGYCGFQSNGDRVCVLLDATLTVKCRPAVKT